jgi:hypothetical protein
MPAEGKQGQGQKIPGLVLFGRPPHAFARPLSIKRRVASENSGLSGWVAPHFTIALRMLAGIRSTTCGSFPVAGRPRFLGITFIDFFMF